MKLQLHWISSNMIILTIIVSMLGMIQVATAVQHQPFRDWNLCPPQCQDDSPYDSMQYWNSAVISVAVTQIPTQNMFEQAANKIMRYADQMKADGSMAVAQTAVLQSIANGSFYSTQLNAKAGANTIMVYGGAVTQAQLQGQMNLVQLAHRQAAAAYIETYGLYSYIQGYANSLIQFGEEYGAQHHPSHKFYIHQPKDIMEGFFLGAIAVGGVLSCFTGVPEAIGVGMIVGAGIGAFAYWACCQ